MSPADDAVDRALRAAEAALIALAAHELSNRLATMRETVGLLDDLARAGKSGASGTARAHASLDEQVERALAVVRALQAQGVDPTRLAAAGYGEFQPIAANDTPEGCSLNRRIEIVLAAAP